MDLNFDVLTKLSTIIKCKKGQSGYTQTTWIEKWMGVHQVSS